MLRKMVNLLWIAMLLAATGGSAALASGEIAEQEGLECAICHDDPEIAKLSDRGRYFQYMRTLEGYELVVQQFGRCTYCHVKDPGSLDLTKDGYRFRWMMEDMEGLRVWLEENHPKPLDEGDQNSQTDSEPENDKG